MADITITGNTALSLHRLMTDTRSWCSRHQAEIGVIEMALGGALVAWGVQNGLIEMGTDLVATALSDQGLSTALGAAAGGAVGSLPGIILGSIGVATAGTAIGIPAAIVIGGGAFILSGMGYAVTDLVAEFLKPDLIELLKTASVAVVGAALLIDGARRLIKDERVLAAASRLAEGVLHVSDLTAEVIAKTWDELKALMDDMFTMPQSSGDAFGSAAGAFGGAAAGAAAGGAVAAGTVTVLGSSTLGAAALSLGLVSAPVWPVIAAGAVGLAAGYAAWKVARRWRGKPDDESETVV